MTDDLGKEIPTSSVPEKPKPSTTTPERKPAGPAEQGAIRRIKEDGNPDLVLRDIAGASPGRQVENDFTQALRVEGQREIRTVGGEVVEPTVNVGETLPEAQTRTFLEAIGRAAINPDSTLTERQANVQVLVDAAKAAGVSREDLAACLQSLGIEITLREQTQLPTEQASNPSHSGPEQGGVVLPSPPYEEIARTLPLNEARPPRHETFIQPVAGNMFKEDDQATLAGRVAASVYDHLVRREGYVRAGNPQEIIERGRQTAEDFVAYVREINERRGMAGLSEYSLAVTRESGTDGFHFNGETGRYSRDHLFYFNKSKTHWENPGEPEVRAFLTLSPEQGDQIQRHFVDLSNELYNAGVDFTGKATSPYGFESRTDDIVFYISSPDQPKAAEIIKRYLTEKGVGEGHVMAAVPSPQEGLSWAMEPDDAQNQIWREISGSSEKVSFNSFVGAMAMPGYLERLADAHERIGDVEQADVFRTEAKRIKDIIARHSQLK